MIRRRREREDEQEKQLQMEKEADVDDVSQDYVTHEARKVPKLT